MTAADKPKFKQSKINENASTSIIVENATGSEKAKLKHVRRWSRSDFGYDSNSDSSNSSNDNSSCQRTKSLSRENPELLIDYRRFVQIEDITLLRVMTYINCVDICDEIISNLSFEEIASDEDTDDNEIVDEKKTN
jgi:hypothetical protein